jgi:hypothetical protein
MPDIVWGIFLGYSNNMFQKNFVANGWSLFILNGDENIGTMGCYQNVAPTGLGA